MKIKYNRVSTILQSGNRFEADTDTYDLTLLDKVSGSVSFKDRVEAKKLVQLVEDGKVTELVTEEFSRLGRNTGNVISTLDWLDQYKVNVRIRNLGIESRPNGMKNPVWKILSATMSSLYEMELENIKERTTTGRNGEGLQVPT
jgi:DNA invertase Pin-like site-specific DNA recombinase